jgi:thiosulfate/3-mercaptopyruvate sulfurtransferase
MSAVQYAHPEAIITTGWAAAHLNDPNVRFIEVDADRSLYEQGHVTGAVALNWLTELSHPLIRDVGPMDELEKLLSKAGIRNESSIVLYGDANNCYAAYAFWVLKFYGHQDVRLMNGGCKKWIEESRETTSVIKRFLPSQYAAPGRDESIRARRDLILHTVKHFDRVLIDVRPIQEYNGEIIAPAGIGESARRGGHIPGAICIPTELIVRPDGLFRMRDELERIFGRRGLTPDRETIVYCRTGERAALSWFALKYLLGFEKTRLYDGGWTEYGNLVGVPIEKG